MAYTLHVTYTLDPIPAFVIFKKSKVLVRSEGGEFSCLTNKIDSICVYLQIPCDHPWASITDPDEIRIRAGYGSATYASSRFPLEGTSYSMPPNVPADGFWIGWDYQNVENEKEQTDLIKQAIVRVYEDVNAAAKPILTTLSTTDEALSSEPAESYMEEVD